ncbi:three-Cys-motif partner protein TcmP [Paraburkholderia caledonica]|uniref:Three-Cys-motif partner protein n=1 Tax=Paraburkholderia caledonica TaxID=134536 RepID=A0AB73IMP9_9BURK|nr:three-Cys-motif partner protein [Paraburkholderia caledonica]
MKNTESEKPVFDPVDGLPVMKVGEWSELKHIALSRYVDSARGARARWGYTSFIDLFCGPGRVINRETKEMLDGGVLAAWKMSARGQGPFSQVFIGDLDGDAVDACERRLVAANAPVRSFVGSAIQTIDKVMAQLPRGLHFAYLDPFSIEQLDFELIRKLSSQRHIDILIHFSVMDVQRNIGGDFKLSSSRLDAAAPGWRDALKLDALPKREHVGAYLEYWESLVVELARMRVSANKPLFVNANRGPLYRLIHLSRHELPQKLWSDAALPKSTQQRLPF